MKTRRRPIIEAVLLEKAQLGWRCTMAFYVTTHTQSTDELVNVVSGGETILAALWNTYQDVRQVRAEKRATPGPFNLEAAK